MKKLPQRPRPHVLETESRRFIERILPVEWIIREINTDYGIDLEVEIVDQSLVTGVHFLIQVKSSEILTINKKGYISHSCKTTALQYYLERSELVIYLVYDATRKTGYWVWIQEFLNNRTSQDWKKQKKFTVQIPGKNLFTKETVEKIKNRVLRSHKQEKILNTINSLNHPGIKYGLEFRENTVIVNTSYKYPKAEKDYPLSFGLTLNFGDSEEGRKAQEAWENAFKKGTPAEVDARFIKEFTTPQELAVIDGLFNDEKFSPDALIIVPLKRDKKFPAKIEVFNSANELVAQIPYIEFKEIRYGTEESVFSNREQKIQTEFSILVNLFKREAVLSFKLNHKGFNVAQVKDALNLQYAFAIGGRFQMVHLDTNIEIINLEFPKDLVSLPLDIHIEIANKLSLIQKLTKKIFLWPEKITVKDYETINNIVEVLTKGEINIGKQISFKLPVTSAIALRENFSNSSKMMFVFNGDEEIVKIFEHNINLGERKILAAKASLSKSTQEKIDSLDAQTKDLEVEIELDVDDPGTIIQYLNWFSADKTKGENDA
jgi:hypothetical protein